MDKSEGSNRNGLSSPSQDGVDPELVDSIRERMGHLREKIDSLSAPGKVKIVSVTKGFPVGVTRAAYFAGVRDIGENYVQELVDKYRLSSDLPGLIRHFIGHIQSNKLRTIAEVSDVVETISRPSELERLNRLAFRGSVLIQVKFDSDPARSGVASDKVLELVELGRTLQLNIQGLMTIAPIVDPKGRGEVFRLLRVLCDDLDLPECSMGMSDDFEIAVAEGATMVRLGSAIFGQRLTKN
ncbi:MAG: YggS family pyridoxal phosphate-dependent enzyme [Acidimicrobiaceae bacterium]|nr:YggS family pyridoxal phosphate-dependent enzyme [Acidimicrobiaceae bacterium]